MAYSRLLYLAVLVSGLALVVAVWQPASAQAAESYAIDIAHVPAEPKIDGTLDDPLWQKASHVQLEWDYQFRRPASEKTDAYIMADGQFIYVAVVAQQAEPITATIHTNDVALAADDVVRVYLWPGGDHGFEYFFVSTPIGTHNQISTENSAFTPAWTSIGRRTATGYMVTMRIPLKVMRGDGRSTWRVQFERAVHVTGQDYEWAHDSSQTAVDASQYVGYLNGMTVAEAARPRPQARVGVYTLGQIASASAGGNTSHMGADIAIPITETSSFFSTLHPDYSNVDLDQQTISPTAFPRQISEVRPFFTQGGNFFNNFNCNDCVDYPFLYTPYIPTPREGYAVEGVQGLANFAAFDSLGKYGRSDDAEALSWQTQDKRVTVNSMRFGTNCQSPDPFPCLPGSPGLPGFHDEALLYQLTVGNHRNWSTYFTGGGEHGSFVTDPTKAQFREWGFNLFTQKFGFFPAYHDIGPQYAPTDQFIQISDVHGPSLFVRNTWDNAPTSPIRSFQVSQDIQHYRNSAGQLDLADAFSNLTVNTKTQFQLNVSTGYQYVLIGNYGSTINQNGMSLSYGSNTSAPTTVTYNIGRFGPGYLRTTTRLVTLRTGPRGTLTLEADNTNQTTDPCPGAPPQPEGCNTKAVQWLERASYAFPISPQSSLALGARRILGTSPYVAPPPAFCPPHHNFPGCTITASNVSLAYYRHVGQDEIYVVYGDPNLLSTLPAFIVKYVHYFGAQKGT